MDILALLQPIEDSLSKATLRQMSRGILAMLAMTGRVTMLGVARWAGKGGSWTWKGLFAYDLDLSLLNVDPHVPVPIVPNLMKQQVLSFEDLSQPARLLL